MQSFTPHIALRLPAGEANSFIYIHTGTYSNGGCTHTPTVRLLLCLTNLVKAIQQTVVAP